MDECVEKVFTSTTDHTKNNISYIRSIRNKATHLIIPDYDFILSTAYQRCISNFNAFFKKQFPNHNFNNKITPFIALTNPGNNKSNSLILNPMTLITQEKLYEELITDENLGQTLRLVSTKKEADADLVYSISKDSNEKAKLIEVPKDIEKTHPYKTNDAIKKICESLELALGIEHCFTKNTFQQICKSYKIKENQMYCYQFYYSGIIYKYSDLAIEYITSLYIENIKNKQ